MIRVRRLKRIGSGKIANGMAIPTMNQYGIWTISRYAVRDHWKPAFGTCEAAWLDKFHPCLGRLRDTVLGAAGVCSSFGTSTRTKCTCPQSELIFVCTP